MIAALVPAKQLDRAKGRLAALLPDEHRRALALAMLEDVLGALNGVARIDMAAVVSPDQEVLDLARRLGCDAIGEPALTRGINQALSFALSKITPRAQPEALLVLLADVPAVSPADIERVLEALPEERGLVLCPSHDRGTSALAMRPPGVIPFRFGAHSFPAHKREAAARRIPAHVLHIESLSRDIDSPDDLRHLIANPSGRATQRLLAGLELAERARR